MFPVAYKKNVGDLRESPALDIIHLLHSKGAHVAYHDPYVPRLRIDEPQTQDLILTSVNDLDAALRESDCVVVATDHSCYDWVSVAGSAKLLVDTRHALG